MDQNRIAILSNHYRRSLYFEAGMKALDDAGFHRIVIQENGGERWGAYAGPAAEIINPGNRSFDEGMVLFRDYMTLHRKIDYVLLIDNDCFVDPAAQNGADGAENFVQQAIDEKYDWVSHPANGLGRYSDKFAEKDRIIHVTDQKFGPSDVYPGFIPDPHYENSYTFMSRNVFDSLSSLEFSHTRLTIRAMHNRNMKMGIHCADYRCGTFTHFGEGWFHIGDIMQYYRAVEDSNIGFIGGRGEYGLARLGYFAAQENSFGMQIYPPEIQGKLNSMYFALGKEKALAAWNDLVRGTFLEGR